MDVLKDKAKKNYEYTSRYGSFYYYYNTVDDKYVYGLTNQLSLDNVYVIHNVKQGDTLDKLSLKYYGRPDLYWIIADFNRIQDSLMPIVGKYDTLKIPAYTGVKFMR